MSRYREQVAAALEAVTILGPTRYAWLGRRNRRLPTALNAELDEAERRRYLISCLSEELYHSFYCHGSPVPARWGEPAPPFADPWLLEELSAANRGHGSWEGGWTVERVDNGEVVVTDSRLRMKAPAADCRISGAAASVRLPKELPSLSPGFWFVVSDVPSAACDVRVYWNVTAAGAPALVGSLTSRLNADGVPFRLKVADHPFRFQRCDAAVLYLEREAFLALRSWLRQAASSLSRHLEPAIPAFTLELAAGVALAEDDGVESFGARRCGLLADAIVRAPALDAVAARFAEDGVDIDAPYRAARHVL
jgi:class II lanthipeptide synthase